MNKSIPTILGLGAAGCVLLSVMMKNLLEHDSEQSRSPHAPMILAKFGSRLVGPVRIRDEADGARVRKRLRAKVRGGMTAAKTRALADDIADKLWFSVRRAGEKPDELVVELVDEETRESSEFVVPAPTAR